MFRRMFATDDQDRASTVITVAAIVSRAPCFMRAGLGVALAASLWWSPAAALAGETAPSAGTDADTVVFGLTATQLVVAAAVGAGAGTVAAVASGNVIAGASLGFGTLGAIYVAHLAAEALVVGGVYYWWPWESEAEAPASRAIAIRGPIDAGGAMSTPLRVAPRP